MKLELRNLRLRLASFTLALDAVAEGKITGLCGPSGAGKTSLLELIAGLRRPESGVIRLDEALLTDAGARHFTAPESRNIGYVPQDGALFPHLSVRKNLLYGQTARRPTAQLLTLEQVGAVLEITSLLDRSIRTLSGGEKQRVALGRALLAGPRLLLLDEPLASLDPSLKQRLLPYFLRIRDEFGVPIIYVTHSPDELMALCDIVLLLDGGHLVKQGKTADLFRVARQNSYELKDEYSL